MKLDTPARNGWIQHFECRQGLASSSPAFFSLLGKSACPIPMPFSHRSSDGTLEVFSGPSLPLSGNSPQSLFFPALTIDSFCSEIAGDFGKEAQKDLPSPQLSEKRVVWFRYGARLLVCRPSGGTLPDSPQISNRTRVENAGRFLRTKSIRWENWEWSTSFQYYWRDHL